MPVTRINHNSNVCANRIRPLIHFLTQNVSIVFIVSYFSLSITLLYLLGLRYTSGVLLRSKHLIKLYPYIIITSNSLTSSIKERYGVYQYALGHMNGKGLLQRRPAENNAAVMSIRECTIPINAIAISQSNS